MPAGQEMHVDESGLRLVPIGHGLQVPLLVTTWPEGQGSQPMLPIDLKPEGHAEQNWSPVRGATNPGGHERQCSSAVVGAQVPTGQGSHLPLDAKVPGLQGVHSETVPPGLTYPSSHEI